MFFPLTSQKTYVLIDPVLAKQPSNAMFRWPELGALVTSALIAGSMFLLTSIVKVGGVFFFGKVKGTKLTLVFQIPPEVRCLIGMFLGSKYLQKPGVWKPRVSEFFWNFAGIFGKKTPEQKT